MALFKFGKKRNILDLSEKYRKQQEKLQTPTETSSTDTQQPSSAGGFSFLGNLASSSNSAPQTSDNYATLGEDAETKRKKLAKRFMDMTTKIEELSNQIYHLQQRIEVLERKSGISIE